MKKGIITISLLLLTFILGAQEMPLSSYYFYVAVYREDVKWVQKHLEAGYNPNKCRGEAGWVDSIPLKVLIEGFTNNYYNKIEEKPLNYRDLIILRLLVENGAHINQLPYIWDRVYSFNNKNLKSWEREREFRGESMFSFDIKFQKDCFVEDANRLLQAYLDAGADPNMKGHPFPFGKSRKLLFFTDKKAFKYFNSSEATTPLYEAIKKGMQWESQVDLLLKYGAAVDESCLEAAKLSGEEAMVEKIQKLFEGVK